MRVHKLAVLRRYPHPGRGFTQGVITSGGTVWESTGLYGESTLRRYRLGDEQPSMSAALAPELFGEGICRAGNQIWQLTWQERVALCWDPQTLELLGTAGYNREGWGICTAGDHVLTSDGSSELVRRDPATLEPTGLIRVRCGNRGVYGLNDLDTSGGLIWANVFGRSSLAGIDPASGEVTDVVDARAALERSGDPDAVLNGITALPDPGEFLLTGKGWRYLCHVRLAPGRHRNPSRLLTG
jgi:glutaminyl-peptide cyclotransferase